MNENQTPSQQLSSIQSWDQLREFIASVSEQMKETDRRMQETDRKMQETAEQMKETDRKIQETDRIVKENARQIKESDRKMKELNSQFISQSGHIVEGLMEPAALNLFKAAGFEIVGCWKEMKGTSKTTGKKMEIDLFYHDTTEAIAVEVKINCTKKKVDHFMEQMSHFKEVFPKYADTKIYAAIAALNYEKAADEYAAEKGLFVIRVSDNDVFTLDATKKEDRMYF